MEVPCRQDRDDLTEASDASPQARGLKLMFTPSFPPDSKRRCRHELERSRHELSLALGSGMERALLGGGVETDYTNTCKNEVSLKSAEGLALPPFVDCILNDELIFWRAAIKNVLKGSSAASRLK